jgi:hypothetical protein
MVANEGGGIWRGGGTQPRVCSNLSAADVWVLRLGYFYDRQQPPDPVGVQKNVV